MNHAKLIIFDLDGTLFRTETVDIQAFNRALNTIGYKPLTDMEILDFIGFPLEQICEKMLSTKDRFLIERFKKEIINNEAQLIESSGELYPGVLEFLGRLKRKNLILCICSNGNKEYVEAIAAKFDLGSIFNDIWYEKNGITKSQAVSTLKAKYGVDTFIMVGDRLSDIESARNNNGISIGISYGYGGKEIENADYIAGSVTELEAIINNIAV